VIGLQSTQPRTVRAKFTQVLRRNMERAPSWDSIAQKRTYQELTRNLYLQLRAHGLGT